jgi:hypothetical protein
VNVRVVDAGDYRSAAEIDLFRVMPSNGPDFRRVAGCCDALPTNRECLHIRVRSIAGENLSVEQNQVWRSLLAFSCSLE